jgi:hypothetical protein
MTGHEKNKRQIYFEQATMASIKNKFDGKAEKCEISIIVCLQHLHIKMYDSVNYRSSSQSE